MAGETGCVRVCVEKRVYCVGLNSAQNDASLAAYIPTNVYPYAFLITRSARHFTLNMPCFSVTLLTPSDPVSAAAMSRR